MSNPPKTLGQASSFTIDTIPRVRTPCRAYSGFAAAIETYNGEPIIVMAATKTALVDAAREINPRIAALDLSLCKRASIIDNTYIDRNPTPEEDEEL